MFILSEFMDFFIILIRFNLNGLKWVMYTNGVGKDEIKYIYSLTGTICLVALLKLNSKKIGYFYYLEGFKQITFLVLQRS